MFEIKCLVDEKHLPKALYALDGLVGNLQVIPVRNARVTKGGEVKSITPTGSVREAIWQFMVDKKRSNLFTHEAVQIARDMGKHPNSGNSAIVEMVAQKMLKPIPGKRGEYKVPV